MDEIKDIANDHLLESVVCSYCSATESMIWRRLKDEDQKDALFCNECCIQLNKVKNTTNQKKDTALIENSNQNMEEDRSEAASEASQIAFSTQDQTIRKSARSKRGTKTAALAMKSQMQKGKGRRHIFKQCPIKTMPSISYPVTSEAIIFQGIKYRVGDIVSIIDDEDKHTYFAQLRGFVQDQYCEKSAALTWLIPTSSEVWNEQEFYPAHYLLGPEEDIPRKLSCMEFVCHAPSDYYMAPASPYPVLKSDVNKDRGFIWARLGPTLVQRNFNS